MAKVLRRKLTLSIITLVLLIATFTTATYAWFNILTEASVENFEFNAHGGDGFLLSIDNEHWYNRLTTRQMKMAIIQGYDSSRYVIEDEKLYDIAGRKREILDDEIDLMLYGNAQNEIDSIISLSPVTSKDGIEFYSLVNNRIYSNSGNFIQLNIWFKSTSDNVSDGFISDVYLSGNDVTIQGGTRIPKTTIESNVKVIPLLDDMTLNDGTIIGPDKDKTHIEVYSSNALRFSIQDTSIETETPVATIYEITNEYDLGSYATDYDKATDLSSLDEAKKDELNKLYNADLNPMYTYYNNLRPNSRLDKMKYENMPKTIRELTDETIITRVTSGSGGKMLTFRFWLEGWDADCFDGLSESINVKLLFDSKSVSKNN